MKVLPISAVIPTVGRSARLAETIRSILSQNALPSRIIIIDGGSCCVGFGGVIQLANRFGVTIDVEKAQKIGAGFQRNQGVQAANTDFIWFLDDDIDLEPNCLQVLWDTIKGNINLGGCNATITNQMYHQPGRTMRWLLKFVGCPHSGSLAGKCVGPCLNFLPAPQADDSPQRMDWLNTTCTLYRRQALPCPPFLSFFQGYSLLEDLALSLDVGKRWDLANCPGARIFHDTQPADYKSQLVRRQAMEVANRWFILTKVIESDDNRSLMRLLIYQGIGLLGLLAKPSNWLSVPSWIAGTAAGLSRIIRESSGWQGYPKEESENKG